MSAYASNAILSKSRAMYGKRLTESDYKKLLSCGSVPEVLTYLKGNSKYAPLMSKLSEKTVRRRDLEAVLRQKLFQDYESLCRYEITVGEDFARYTVMKAEIGQIIHYLIMLSSGEPHKFYSTLPKYFLRISSLNFTAMAGAQTYDEFLSVIRKSDYYKLLEPFRPKKGEKLNLADIENTLYNNMFGKVYEIIEKTSGEEKKALQDMFDTNIDLRNFTRIFRLKKYYKLEPDEIKKHLLPFGSLNERQISELCSANDTKELFALMKQTAPGKVISKLDYTFIFEIPRRALYEESYKSMYFSVNPSVVLVAFYNLEEAEINNIINIIEGVRYKADTEKIRKLLIYK